MLTVVMWMEKGMDRVIDSHRLFCLPVRYEAGPNKISLTQLGLAAKRSFVMRAVRRPTQKPIPFGAYATPSTSTSVMYSSILVTLLARNLVYRRDLSFIRWRSRLTGVC